MYCDLTLKRLCASSRILHLRMQPVNAGQQLIFLNASTSAAQRQPKYIPGVRLTVEQKFVAFLLDKPEVTLHTGIDVSEARPGDVQ